VGVERLQAQQRAAKCGENAGDAGVRYYKVEAVRK